MFPANTIMTFLLSPLSMLLIVMGLRCSFSQHLPYIVSFATYRAYGNQLTHVVRTVVGVYRGISRILKSLPQYLEQPAANRLEQHTADE